jgi:ABC-type polar amino acid transport system ATPase subunit
MIQVENLTKRFGTLQVLRGASLSVERGEVAVIIGASGCGKSTLLRCINALETFDGGQVRVGDLLLHPQDAARAQSRGSFDRRQTGVEHQLRRRVGMVFQQFNLFPHMSVLENVMSGPVYALGLDRAAAADRARRLLERVGLADKLNQRPTTLSGGQQQRVAIARALANQPEVMLFDEPTSALDPRMTHEVLAVMADLASSGQTMLVTSHAMGFVRRSAHRVHVMHAGQVIESGPPAQIFDHAQQPQTRELLAEAAT